MASWGGAFAGAASVVAVYGGGGMGATDACTATTDAEVIAKWNAKTAVPTARTAATDTGYGLKSLGYSMYC